MRDEQGTVDLWNAPSAARILVVDTDPTLARTLTDRLGRGGHQLAAAAGYAEALSLAETHPFDVALVDLDLEAPGCFELVAALRAKDAQLEAIVMTVDPTVEICVDALERGAWDVVVKPFANVTLVTAKLAHAIAKVHSERHREELMRILQTHDVETSAATGDVAGDGGSAVSTVGIDIDEMAGSDPVTGLSNRRLGEERFREETSRALRYDRPLCVAMARVDGLEELNEAEGQEVADAVIRGIVSLFLGSIRDVDFVSHRGEGDFLFLFPETTKEHGILVMERIRQKIAQSSFVQVTEGRDEIRFTLSAGVAGLPGDTMNHDLLDRCATDALEAAAAETDRVLPYDPEHSSRS